MYDFYKVKGGKNHQEFKHPNFKRHYYRDLAYIKRKSVHKTNNTDFEPNIDEQSDDDNEVQEKLEAVRKSLDIVTTQNKNLIDANREMIAKLCNFKVEYEIRLKKLFFVFAVLVHNYDDELLEALKKPLEQLNIDHDGITKKKNGYDISKCIELLCKRMVINDIDNQRLLDELIDVFFGYFELKGSPIKKENFIFQENANHQHSDDFSISLFNAETMDDLVNPQVRNSLCFKTPKSNMPKVEINRMLFFRDTSCQNLLQSPSKPNEINFDDLNLNDDDNGNALLEKRDEDSFLMSGANSVLMLSPFKRNI